MHKLKNFCKIFSLAAKQPHRGALTITETLTFAFTITVTGTVTARNRTTKQDISPKVKEGKENIFCAMKKRVF